MTVNVTGVAATGSVGTVTTVAKAVVSPTGIAATGQVGQVLVWGSVVPNQNPNYTTTNPTQSPNWTDIAA